MPIPLPERGAPLYNTKDKWADIETANVAFGYGIAVTPLHLIAGVAALTKLSAEYAGNVSVSYSYDGRDYSPPAPLAELLDMNPARLFAGVRQDAPSLRFRFRLADDGADLSSFTLWGVFARDLP